MRRTFTRAAAALVFLLRTAGGAEALDAEGSLLLQAGGAGPLPGQPPGPGPEWLAGLLLSGRVTGSSEAAEVALEGTYANDVVSRMGALFLEEAWAAWKPVDGISLRLGRQRIGFGCGFAWSVVDDLDPQPMPFDPHSPRIGLDAVRFSVDFASVGAPVQTSLEAYAPRGGGASSLLMVNDITGGLAGASLGAGASVGSVQDLGAALQLSAFLGGVELGAAGSIRELRADPPASLGGWATVDLAGFVVGAEGAWEDGHGEYLLNCNKRLGDFGTIVEARWLPDDARVWLFGLLSWESGGFGVDVSALFTVKEAGGLVEAGFTYTASDALVLSLAGAWYVNGEALPEIGPLPWHYSATFSAEYFF